MAPDVENSVLVTSLFFSAVSVQLFVSSQQLFYFFLFYPCIYRDGPHNKWHDIINAEYFHFKFLLRSKNKFYFSNYYFILLLI